MKKKTKTAYKVSLAVVLPWDEFPDKERFKSFVEALLPTTSYRGQALSVELESFSVRQEGFGLFYLYQKSQKKPYFDEMAILMFGHRNLSLLYFRENKLHSGSSPLLGFHRVFDAIAQRLSWVSTEQLIEAFYDVWTGYSYEFFQGEKVQLSNVDSYDGSYGHKGYDHHVLVTMKYPVWKEFSDIEELARAKDPDLRQGEIEDIERAINMALEQYWESVEKWYSQTFNQPVRKLLISGGASWFILPKFLSFCKRATLVSFTEKVRELKVCGNDEKFQKVEEIGRYLYRNKLPDWTKTKGTPSSFYEMSSVSLDEEKMYSGESPEILAHDCLDSVVSRYVDDNSRKDRYRSFYPEHSRTTDVIGLAAYLIERGKNG